MIYIVDTGVLATHDEFMTATGSRVIAGYEGRSAHRRSDDRRRNGA
ncbi:MAG TPA: hypothetical protein VF824_22685 [Thermoanaerobaculia bacterium]